MELISNPSDKNCFGKTRNELAHFHATSFKRAFGLVILLALLGACSPTLSEKPTLTSIFKTPTQELVTFTPQPTATFTITPTAILLPMQIPRTATPGSDMISSQNAGNVEVVGIYGNGRAYSARWSSNDKFFTVNTTFGIVLYDAQTWQPIPFSDSFGAYSIFKWSPDGKRLAAVSAFVEETPMVYVYDGETLQQIKIVKTGDRFSWSPDGQNLAIIGDDSVHFYNSQRLDEIAKIIINQPIWRYSFSPDGKRFATLEKNQIRVWDVFTGEKLLAYDVELNDNRSCHLFIFDSQGRHLLLLTSKDSYYYFNVFGEYGQVSYASQANMEYRSGPDATFSPDGRQTALFIYETIVIQETGTGKIIKTISVPDVGDFIESGIKIAYSSDGKKIITTAGIFDVESGKKLNNQGFPQFQLSSNGQTLAFSTRKKNKDDRGVWLIEDTGVELWNVVQGQPLNVLPGIYNARYEVSFNNAGTQIAFFDEYGNILVHDIQTGKLLHQIPFSADVFSLDFGPKTERSVGSLLAVGEDAGKISVWDTGNRQLINTFIGHPNNPVAISPDGQLLAYHSQNGDTVQIVDIFSGKVLRSLSGFDYWVNKIMFSPNGEMLAVNSTNMHELSFWDIRSGKKLKTIIGGGAFRFLQTTNQILRIQDRAIQILDTKSDKTVLELDGEYWYSDVASSFDGRFIAAARDPLIDIWDAATEKMLRSLEGHPVLDGYDSEPTGQVENLMFHPFNYVLASSDIHNTIIIWDVDTGKRIQTICGSKPAYSQDGRIFAYAGCDSRVYLLGLPSTEK